MIAPQGAELLQIKRKLFQKFISADLNSLVAVMVRKNLKSLSQKPYIRVTDIQHITIFENREMIILNGNYTKLRFLVIYLNYRKKVYKFHILGGVMKAPKSTSVALSSTFPSKL